MQDKITSLTYVTPTSRVVIDYNQTTEMIEIRANNLFVAKFDLCEVYDFAADSLKADSSNPGIKRRALEVMVTEILKLLRKV